MGALEQWVARLLGGPARARGDGKKGKAGFKRKSMAETEATDAPAWSPAPQQLRQLLGSCLHALVRITSSGTPPTEQEARVDALQNVAKQLLRRLGSKDAGAESLQRLLSLACLEGHAPDQGSSVAASVDWERQAVAQWEALQAAQDAQGKLMQTAAASAADAASGPGPASHRCASISRAAVSAACTLLAAVF